MVGIDDLSDVMRDDDDGATLFDGIDRGLDLFGGDGIETGCWLIEEDDRWILDEHTGNSNTLLLTTTELQGHGVEAMG